MITVVFVKNPFEPQKNREVRTLPYVKGKDVGYYVQQCTKDLTLPDMVISRNSYTINGSQAVQDKDFIVFSPVVGKGHGKNPLLIIATVALSVTAMGVGGLVAAGSFSGAALASATGFAAIGGYLAAAAVMFIGGSLIQRAFGTANTSGFKDTSENPTYSWTGITTTNGQNNPIPITYGTVRSGGQTIGKYINSDSDKQYLNWLVSAGYGPLKIYDIQLNDNPIENYKGVKLDTREGTNTQDVVPNFNDTISTKTLGYEILDNDWRTDLVTGTATQGLIIYVECSNGLYYANDKGGLDETYVTIEAQYAKKGTSDWKELATNVRITGNKSSAIRKQYRVDNLEAGQYQVRVKVVSRGYPTTSTRACTRIWWTGVSGIVYDDFSYPGIALIGIRAMATDQLSGSPTLKFMKQRSTVYVWNPSTKAYEKKAATNPAWAAYDMVHRANKITDARNGSTVYIHNGADASLMMYNQFSEWAAYCDQFNLKINIEINTSGELLDVVNRYIAPVGRGIVELFGTKYGCVWDGPKEAVQMFGMGNIISGTFTETFLQTSDRANAVEVTFTNAQKDYERDTVKVYGPTFDTDEYDTTSQLTYDGITDYEQAYREAKFQLYCNAYMVRTVSFQAAIDAIACTVGDVIYVAHDVPMWQTSGRIASVSGTTVVINAVMQSYDSTKTYTFAYRSSVTDTRYEVGCKSITVGDATTTVVLTSVPESAPAAGDIFDIAEVSKGTKKFVVRSISRTEDLVREIEALEYNEAVFNENYTIPTPNNSESGVSTVQNVTDLTGKQVVWMDAAGQIHAKLYLSWQYPAERPYQYFSVFVSTDNNSFTALGTSLSKYFESEVAVDTTYYVKVITVNRLQKSSGVITVVEPGHVTPAVTPIDIVAIGKYTLLPDGTPYYAIELSWGPDKLVGRVYYKRTGTQVKDAVMTQGVALNQVGYSADWTFAGLGTNQITISPVAAGERYKFCVCTADGFGRYVLADDAPFTEILMDPKTLIPNTPDNVELTFDNASHLRWDSVTNCDIQYYEIRLDTDYGNETDKLLVRTNRLSTTITLKERKGTVYVFACSTDNKYSRPAVVNYNKVAPDAPTLDAVAGIGQIRLQVGPIPGGALGVHFYVDDQMADTPNVAINYMVKKAGEYDVSAAYYDLFGDGAKCAVLQVYVKNKVDTEFLEKNAVALDNVDATIKKAVEDTQTTLPNNIDDAKNIATEAGDAAKAIADNLNVDPGSTGYKAISDLKTTTDGISANVAQYKKNVDGSISALATKVDTNASGISAVVANLSAAPGDSPYGSISELKQQADNISATVVSNKKNVDGTISTLSTKVEANATGVSTIVSNLNSEDPSKTGYKAISALKQTTDSISSTVAANKTAADGSISSLSSRVSQQADQITSIVSDVKTVSDKTESNYSAIVQNQSDIALRVKKGEIIGQINATPETATIDFKHLDITGSTLFQKDITISDTEKGGLVGGSVRIDNKGMTVNNANGTAVAFGKNGMEFVDTNGVAFNTVGRFCTGTAQDGQMVTFTKPWDVVPNVFVFPVYQNYKINKALTDAAKQRLYAENVTKEGFRVVFNTYVDGTEVTITTPDYLDYHSDNQTYNGTELTYMDTKPTGATEAGSVGYQTAWYHWSKTFDIPLGFAASSVSLGVASMHTLKPFSDAAYARSDGKSGWEIYKIVSQTGTRNGKSYNRILYYLNGQSEVGFDILDDNGTVLKTASASVRDVFNSSFIKNDDTTKTVKETIGFGTGWVTVKFPSTMSTLHLRVWENLYLSSVLEYLGDSAAAGYEWVTPSPSSDITKAFASKIYISNTIYTTKADGETILDRGIVGFIATDPNSVNYTLK